jgi:hypothetical protein
VICKEARKLFKRIILKTLPENRAGGLPYNFLDLSSIFGGVVHA